MSYQSDVQTRSPRGDGRRVTDAESDRMADDRKSRATNPTLEFLKANNIPATRENYLAVEFLGNPAELDAEREAALPWQVILAARRLGDWSGGSMSPKEAAAIGDAVRIAHRIIQHIDSQFPDQPKNNWRENLREKDTWH